MTQDNQPTEGWEERFDAKAEESFAKDGFLTTDLYDSSAAMPINWSLDAEAIKSFIRSLLQEIEQRVGRETELLKSAYEELLELRGFLVQRGQFNPDIDKLEEYWNSGKPEWEKEISKI